MLDDAAIFVQVVKAGSFSAASRATEIPVSTISDRVAALEARLGVVLLKRTTRRLFLTENGQAYYDLAQRIVREIQDFEADLMRAAPLISGKLRIGSTLALDAMLAPIITAYLREHKNIEIELVMNAQNEDLIGGQLDAAIRIGQLVDDSNLMVRVLGKSVVQLFASRDYIDAVPAICGPEDLISADILCFTGTNQIELHHESGVSTHLRPNPRFSSNQMSSILHQAVAGFGIAVLPTALVKSDLEASRLLPVLPNWHCGVTPINIVYPRHSIMPAKVRSVIDMLVAHFPKLNIESHYAAERKVNPARAK